MEKVIKYRCDWCGKLLDSEEGCLSHENLHERIEEANKMLREGYTLQSINEKCNVWKSIPKHLENVNKDNCFTISWWQCCSKPAYRIDAIRLDGGVRVWGCGSWDGYYGNWLSIYNDDLKDPRPKEELFVYSRNRY